MIVEYWYIALPVKIVFFWWLIGLGLRMNEEVKRDNAIYEENMRRGYDPHMAERAAAYRKQRERG
jgi:hypothetical protein